MVSWKLPLPHTSIYLYVYHSSPWLILGQHDNYMKLSHFHITLQPSTTVKVDKSCFILGLHHPATVTKHNTLSQANPGTCGSRLHRPQWTHWLTQGCWPGFYFQLEFPPLGTFGPHPQGHFPGSLFSAPPCPLLWHWRVSGLASCRVQWEDSGISCFISAGNQVLWASQTPLRRHQGDIYVGSCKDLRQDPQGMIAGGHVLGVTLERHLHLKGHKNVEEPVKRNITKHKMGPHPLAKHGAALAGPRARSRPSYCG